MRETIAIIDGVSSGSLLSGAVRARGYDCVHILSDPEHEAWTSEALDEILPRRIVDLREYDDAIVHDGDLGRLLEWLKAKNTRAIIPGIDLGVPLADEVAELLKLPGNDPSTTHLRRDKYEMIEAVRARGLNAPWQTRARTVDELLDWAEVVMAQHWPVVLKPPASAGAMMVTPCRSAAEIREACAAMFGQADPYNGVVNEIVAQTALLGEDYIVDTVSCAGTAHVTDIWKYEKVPIRGVPVLGKTRTLLPFEGPIQARLIAYTRAVLNAVKLDCGPAHVELKFNEHGPALVEINPRLIGAMSPEIIAECTGYGPLDVTLDAFLEPWRFSEYVGTPYRLRRNGVTAHLLPPEPGLALRPEGVAVIEGLRSFWKAHWGYRPGLPMPKAESLLTLAGTIDLVHDSREVLAEDVALIRAAEKAGLYA